MVALFLVIAVGYAIAFDIACWRIARQKGLNHSLWGLLGFFFGLLALIILLATPSSGTSIQFDNGDGDLLEVTWQEHGVWAARLHTSDGERIDALTPAEIAHFQLKGKNVSEDVVNSLYSRLYRLRPDRQGEPAATNSVGEAQERL